MCSSDHRATTSHRMCISNEQERTGTVNDFISAAGVCESWYLPVQGLRPRPGHTPAIAAMKPELLAPKAAIPAVNRSALPVRPRRTSI